MTSIERFERTLRREKADRVPIDFMAGQAVVGKLKAALGVTGEAELLDELGSDFYYLSVRDISQNETSASIYRGPKLKESDTERVCPFGIRFRRAVRNDKFGADEALEGPLESAETARDILRYRYPDPAWFDVEALIPECGLFSDKVIIGGFWTGIFGDSYRMHGFQNFLMNMAAKPELIAALVGRTTDFYLELNERLFAALKGRMSIFFMGNDFGTQGGLLFSAGMWEEFFMEPYRRLIAQAKSHGLVTMVHSCGAIAPLLPAFAELGVDIIDPVQLTARGMEAVGLKRDFGDRLVFHGGIDTQEILPRGTPDSVSRHVKDTVRELGHGGGYILTSCNNIQADTPVENILAMYRTAKDTSWQGDL